MPQFLCIAKSNRGPQRVNFQPVKKLFLLFHLQWTLDIAEPLRGTKDLLNKGNFPALHLTVTCLAILCTSAAPEGLLQWEGQREGRRSPAFVPGRYPGAWNKTLLRCLAANSKAHDSFHKNFRISGNITCTNLVAGYVACGSQKIVRPRDCWVSQQTMEQDSEFPWYNHSSHFFLKCEVAFKLSIMPKILSGLDC